MVSNWFCRDQPQQMREFEGRDARGLEQAREAGHEIVDVRHMGEHVVGRVRSACCPRREFVRPSATPKNSSTIVMPLARAAAAVLAVGSMPSAGDSRALTYCSR